MGKIQQENVWKPEHIPVIIYQIWSEISSLENI